MYTFIYTNRHTHARARAYSRKNIYVDIWCYILICRTKSRTHVQETLISDDVREVSDDVKDDVRWVSDDVNGAIY